MMFISDKQFTELEMIVGKLSLECGYKKDVAGELTPTECLFTNRQGEKELYEITELSSFDSRIFLRAKSRNSEISQYDIYGTVYFNGNKIFHKPTTSDWDGDIRAFSGYLSDNVGKKVKIKISPEWE